MDMGIYLGDWDVEIKIETKDSTRKQHNEYSECGVLEIRYLNLHTTKFNTPANR